jgi:vancomycin resistance protein YoaR
MSKYTKKHRDIAIAATVAVVSGVTLILSQQAEPLRSAAPAETGQANAAISESVNPLENQALRLQERLQKTTGRFYTVQSLVNALEKRNELLKSSVTVSVNDPKFPGHSAEWIVDVSKYPELVEFQSTYTGPAYVISTDTLKNLVANGTIDGSKVVKDALVTELREGKYVIRAEVSAVARDGFEYNEKMMEDIAHTLMRAGTGTVNITAGYRRGTVSVKDGDKVRQLSLLSSGRSNFDDSPDARIHNVHMALEQKVNNTVVKPGGVYSFNGVLDAPVTVEKGWREALGLFGGGAAMTPGGGICQAATTVYRAALLAGMPIVERRNHSLYVDHYEEYGVGIDATIFPGVHDLRFKNDTSDILVIQSYTDGFLAFVNIYGVDDGRTVDMQGPYFVDTRPRPAELRALGFNEIGWVQHIKRADGTVTSKQLIATYSKPISYRSLGKKYAVSVMTDALHAAAPQQEQ